MPASSGTRPRNFGWKPQLPPWSRSQQKKFGNNYGLFLATRIAGEWGKRDRAMRAANYFVVEGEKLPGIPAPKQVLEVAGKIAEERKSDGKEATALSILQEFWVKPLRGDTGVAHSRSIRNDYLEKTAIRKLRKIKEASKK